MALFENPNDPIQPKPGVYCWYASKGDCKVSLYVGQAGGKNSFTVKGTLFRGVSQVQRNTLSSDSANNYRTVDVDFIIGTVIKLLEQEGFLCTWRHLDDDPSKEINYVRTQKPLLQTDKGHIREQLRLREEQEYYWKLTKYKTQSEKTTRIVEAESRISHVLRTLVKEESLR